ncbi:DNA glycosylase [Lentinula aff. lateritia]|uniref:DNA glycosylase n=1 Tax=Lentinula aff. lateritia TaxID=2804960 RepID=A0ACC1TSZ7_9AGAR|nr:DNA glycosylase [Lentinula aff. lateritia]
MSFTSHPNPRQVQAPKLTTQTSALDACVTLYTLDESNELGEGKESRSEEEEESGEPRMSMTRMRTKHVRNVAESESELEEEEEARALKRVKRVHDSSYGEPSKPRVPARRTPRKPKQPTSTPVTPHPAPAHWRQAYDLIHAMRYTSPGCAQNAPVDTMGCDIAGEAEDDDKNKRFSILISLMLSSQTKDLVTHTAVSNLRSALRGLNASALASASPSLVQESINKVGFWRRKAGYIQSTAVICRDKYGGDVPGTLGELLELPGVGKKMAYLTLASGWGLNVGIGVDVHVHRISNRLGWHDPPTKTPEETRISLESWLPSDLHQKINHLLVGFGQTICSPVKPKCSECSLSSVEGLCPSSSSSSSASSPRKAVKAKAVTKPDKKSTRTKLDTTEEEHIDASETQTQTQTKPETGTETHMQTQSQTETQMNNDSEQKNTMSIKYKENTIVSTTATHRHPPIIGGPRIKIEIEQ